MAIFCVANGPSPAIHEQPKIGRQIFIQSTALSSNSDFCLLRYLRKADLLVDAFPVDLPGLQGKFEQDGLTFVDGSLPPLCKLKTKL